MQLKGRISGSGRCSVKGMKNSVRRQDGDGEGGDHRAIGNDNGKESCCKGGTFCGPAKHLYSWGTRIDLGEVRILTSWSV